MTSASTISARTRELPGLREMMSGEQGADFWRMLEPAADGGCSEAEEGESLLPSYRDADHVPRR